MNTSLSIKNFEEMLSTQYKLNDVQSSPTWIKGINQYNRNCNWKRAIKMELVEALDSFNWKFWKSASDNTEYSISDLENLKVELVDIWHFVMSDKMTETGEVTYEGVMASRVASQLFSAFSSVQDMDMDQVTDKKVYLALEESTFSEKELSLEKLFFAIKYVFSKSNPQDPFEDFYRLYVSKATLNYFRATHGYGEGTYKKLWVYDSVAREDNVIMANIIEQLIERGEFSSENLYKYLEDVYSKQ